MIVNRTEAFAKWLSSLRDKKATVRVNARIDMMAEGHLGDTKAVGGGVLEARIHYGPGYRLYYTIRGGEIIFLLVGGDKGSQARDIAKAQEMAACIPEASSPKTKAKP